MFFLLKIYRDKVSFLLVDAGYVSKLNYQVDKIIVIPPEIVNNSRKRGNIYKKHKYKNIFYA